MVQLVWTTLWPLVKLAMASQKWRCLTQITMWQISRIRWQQPKPNNTSIISLLNSNSNKCTININRLTVNRHRHLNRPSPIWANFLRIPTQWAPVWTLKITSTILFNSKGTTCLTGLQSCRRRRNHSDPKIYFRVPRFLRPWWINNRRNKSRSRQLHSSNRRSSIRSTWSGSRL